MTDEEIAIITEYYRWLAQVELDLNYFFRQADKLNERDRYACVKMTAAILGKVTKARNLTAHAVGINQQSPGLKIDDE